MQMRKQKNLDNLSFDGMEPWRGYLSEVKIELLNKTWAGTFRKLILPTLPVDDLAQHYSKDMGRPSGPPRMESTLAGKAGTATRRSTIRRTSPAASSVNAAMCEATGGSGDSASICARTSSTFRADSLLTHTEVTAASPADSRSP